MLKPICVTVAILFLTPWALPQVARPTLAVDASSPSGEVRHGATGWLYGQSQPGIPPVHMMELLKPKISAQKPPDGLQHPGGDAMVLMPSFKAAGGKLMQIYIQDIYPDWPYNDNGLDDYLKKVAEVAHKVVADPNHASFVYVPFNEPDNNWYGYSGPKFDRFLRDWLAVYRGIRSIDPGAKVAGPNYEHFKAATYEAFFTFARDNHALPDETTWHELHDDFYTGWYQQYDEYRAMEKRLGLQSIPIVINEYAREKGDLAVPGNLVQWIARFENSKVDACLAYWTPTGTLSDLTARTWPNRATGAWWVYYWYAEMTGQTLKVTPPNLNGLGLQGIAAADRGKHQIRILFAGTGSGIDLDLDHLPEWLGKFPHLDLWRVDSSGIQPSPGPQLVSSTKLPVAAGHASFSAPAADDTSAYYVVLTPSPDAAGTRSGHYSAIYDTLTGAATPAYYRDAGTVRLAHTTDTATFVTTAENDGYYSAILRYLIRSPTKLNFSLNGSKADTVNLPANPSNQPFAEVRTTLFLAGGINAFKFSPATKAAGIELMSLDLAPAAGPIDSYRTDAANPGTFAHISAPGAGKYKLIITYSNGEKAHGGPVDDSARITVNGSEPIIEYFRNTFDPAIFRTTVIDIALPTGDNTINITPIPNHGALHITQIQIAKAVLN